MLGVCRGCVRCGPPWDGDGFRGVRGAWGASRPGWRRERPGQARFASHPACSATAPSTARRARFTAAASRAKSAATLGLPRTRARRPPWRRRIKCGRCFARPSAGWLCSRPSRRGLIGAGGRARVAPRGRRRSCAPLRARAPVGQRAAGARRRELRDPPSPNGRSAVVFPAGQLTVPPFRSMRRVLGEPPARRDRRLHLAVDLRVRFSSLSTNSPEP